MTASATQTSRNASLLDRVVSHVTITDPAHPLFRQTLPVVRIPAPSTHEPSIVIQLPTGEHRRVPRAATDLGASGDETASVISPLPISVRTLLPLAHTVRRLLAVREESPDESQAKPAGAAPPETTHPDRHRSATPVAQSDARATPTTGPVSGRTDPAPAPGEANCPRGGAT
jgi:hypothetical protein